MGLIKNLVQGMKSNKAEFKEKLKQAQEDYKIQKTIEERNKSANRRELERDMREREEEQIKKALDHIRKKRNKETWKSNKLILKEPTTMLNNDRPILKEKNIFADAHKFPFTKGGGNMFFK